MCTYFLRQGGSFTFRLIAGMMPLNVVFLGVPSIVLASLAALSASSFPGMPHWPGTH